MQQRERLSATVDSDLLRAGRDEVAAGRVSSVSEWVNRALRRQAEHEARLRALDEFLDAFELEHGEITDEEVADATRRARSRAIVVRGGAPPGRGVA